MNDWSGGFVLGMAVGLSIGLAASRRRKPWSELSDRERKIRIGVMVGLGLVVLAGVAVLIALR
jgi:hypothetical protein